MDVVVDDVVAEPTMLIIVSGSEGVFSILPALSVATL